MRHDIPDDGHPHAPTPECGCGPRVTVLRERGTGELAPARYLHNDMSLDDGRESTRDAAT